MTERHPPQPPFGDRPRRPVWSHGIRGAYEAGRFRPVAAPDRQRNSTDHPRHQCGGAQRSDVGNRDRQRGRECCQRDRGELGEGPPGEGLPHPVEGGPHRASAPRVSATREGSGLVDTTPLQETIEELIQPNDYGHNTKTPHLDTVGIVASACSSRRAVVFVEGGPTPMSSSGDQVQYVQTTLGIPHLLASSAFPIVFPPQWVTDRTIDDDWYVDGGVQLNTAFKPAIDLGADKVLVVGGTPLSTRTGASATDLPTLGDSNGQILHVLLANGIAPDIAHLSLTNQYLRALGSSPPSRASAASGPPRGCDDWSRISRSTRRTIVSTRKRGSSTRRA